MKQFFRDFYTFWKSLPIAKRYVKQMNDEMHPGVVKFQIAYQRVRLALIKEAEIENTEIKGSLVYLALAFQAWRHSK